MQFKLQEHGQTAALEHFFFKYIVTIYCHNAVPEVANPHIIQPISKKKTLTNYTATSRFIIICQIHDIRGKYLETRKQGQTKLRVCTFYVHSLKIKILA